MKTEKEKPKKELISLVSENKSKTEGNKKAKRLALERAEKRYL